MNEETMLQAQSQVKIWRTKEQTIQEHRTQGNKVVSA